MQITVTEKPLAAYQELAQYHQHCAQQAGKIGASAHFIGTMREINEGDAVQSMYLEHYPAMTQQQLQQIASSAQQRWPIHDLLVMHRVGLIRPDETIVVIGVWSAHRGPALAACQYLIETLKSQAPFWKKETLVSGEQRWVAGNTPLEEPPTT